MTQGGEIFDYGNRKFGFEFMEGLVSDMMAKDLEKRPSMDEVVACFSDLRKTGLAGNYGPRRQDR
jgi:hypothetical protein